MEDLIEKKDGELLQKHACDSSDYLIAVACGAVSGLVDIFLVGAPSQSVIGKWTDAQVDEAVKKFAEKSGWSPRPGKEGNVASAIGYLERQYKVNYDQRYSADVGGAFNMSTKNHHIKSLSHSPDMPHLSFWCITCDLLLKQMLPRTQIPPEIGILHRRILCRGH